MAVQPPPALNGRPRKQLCDQLDRLDDVINGMEEFLPQAVADAARDGIRQAFRDVVSELIADPLVLDRLRAALVPEMVPLTVSPRPSAFARLKAVLRCAAAKVVTVFGVAKAVATIAKHQMVGTVTERCAAARHRIARWSLLSLPIKSILSVSLVIGLGVAIVSLATPHVIAAALSGIGATLTAITVQVGNWLRRRQATFGTI